MENCTDTFRSLLISGFMLGLIVGVVLGLVWSIYGVKVSKTTETITADLTIDEITEKLNQLHKELPAGTWSVSIQIEKKED